MSSSFYFNLGIEEFITFLESAFHKQCERGKYGLIEFSSFLSTENTTVCEDQCWAELFELFDYSNS